MASRERGSTLTVESPTRQGLVSYPPPDKWDEWVEYDPQAWPRRVARHYMLIPTVCFNCEAGCGLLAWVDKETLQIRKFEGNPVHAASRGRNCAKGPATINQVNDPDRILYPLKRAGKRGEGKWERVSWDEVLDDIAARIRQALQEGRHNEVMYHVGRPGEDGYTTRVLAAWGTDAHNSHTNVCSAGARAGYSFWGGFDRPSPDHAHADVILLISSHLESGHYFNPHAQRIMEGKMRGARLIVLDTRLSNTASMADYWLSPWPGSEAAILLAIANYLIQNDLYDKDFVRRWVNWEAYLKSANKTSEVVRTSSPETSEVLGRFCFEAFDAALKEIYADYTFEFAAQESGVEAATIEAVAKEVARTAQTGRLATHVWRSAASGNLGGWQVARCLWFLNVLTGSTGTPGGTSPNSWNKFVPRPFDVPAPQRQWNELAWPLEYPLAHYEMSFLLPHFLLEGRGRLEVYFTRVYNPMWINPDGFVWLQALRDEGKIGLHVALTPIWCESAWWADYVLPMGLAPERHDLMSQETHAGQWIAFRQPVLRVAKEKMGQQVQYTYEANPGQVWEENEFWIELSWRIDPDGSLGIRQHFESPYRPGEKITVEEYYRWIFENSVPGLPEAAAAEELTPLAYMRKYGCFEVKRPGEVYRRHEQPVDISGARVDEETGLICKDGKAIGVMVDGEPRVGWNTPSRKLEFYSSTLAEWGWPEYAIPAYIRSHVHREIIQRDENGVLLLPTYRLPTLVHSRSPNAKWLYEISHSNPLWMHPSDAQRFTLKDGDLVRVRTEIGYFVDRVWITEGIRPGVIACSHHLGRWRLSPDLGVSRWASGQVELGEEGEGQFRLRPVEGIRPFKSDDPDSERIWWADAGVNQNLTHAVHPDPVSGMHCWHQRAWIEPAQPGDRYGDVFVDTRKSLEVYRQWLAMTRPAASDLRRPLWLKRPLRPTDEAYRR